MTSQESQLSESIIRENVDYALKMINYVLEHAEISDTDRVIIDQLFPTLTNLLAITGHDVDSVDLITDICTMIATRGLVQPSRDTANSLIEDLSQSLTDPALTAAFEAVDDKEISYKAYGLAQLRELLQQRNAAALHHRMKIYNIFSHYLFHEDSFLYLRAIRGLALLGDQFTDKLLPVIAKKINASRKTQTIEEWLVLGEVFMQIIRNLGDMAPHYRNTILNCLMPQLSDPEELVRASGVTNLGELCCQLEYAFTPVMNEIMQQVCRLLETDVSTPVKVACAVMIRKLLLGRMDAAASGARPEILRLAVMVKLIRQSLERVYFNETDPIVLDHVAVANQSLSQSIRAVPLVCDPSNVDMNISIGGFTGGGLSMKYRKLNF